MTRPVPRVVLRVLGASLALVAGLAAGLPSCTTSPPTTLYTPFTGIRIAAAPLFAGYACGQGPGQVFKYAAIVWDAPDGGTDPADGGLDPADAIAVNVYDCDTDAAFQNLPGNGSYSIEIKAYTVASFPADVAADLACTLTSCPAIKPADFVGPTWTAMCSATQEQGDNSLVVCDPLLPTSPPNDTADADTGD